MEDGYPIASGLGLVFLWFFVALAIFHVALVWSPLRLGKRGWKIVDYFWLGTTALSLLPLTADARMMVAAGLERGSGPRIEGAMNVFGGWVNAYRSPVGLCRKFNPSPLFTPQELAKEQAQFDEMCRWINEVAALLPRDNLSIPIDLSTLPTPPPVAADDLRRVLQDYRAQADGYRAEVDRQAALQRAAGQSATEITLAFLSPFVLAIALALRITKVTGELTLDASAP